MQMTAMWVVLAGVYVLSLLINTTTLSSFVARIGKPVETG